MPNRTDPKTNVPESPTSDNRLATTITAIDFVFKTENAVGIAEIKGGVIVQVLNGDFVLLSVGALDAGVLGLSACKSALESALVAVVAATGSSDVPSGVALVLEHIAAAIAGGSNAVGRGAENNGKGGKDSSGLHVGCVELRLFLVERIAL